MNEGPFFLVLYFCNKKGLRTKFCLWPTTIAHNEIIALPPLLQKNPRSAPGIVSMAYEEKLAYEGLK